jgi:excisionase family DNA binding protein
MATDTAPLAHSVNEACRRLGIGRTSLYELIDAKEIRPFKIGRKTLIPESELQRVIHVRMAGSEAARAA